MGVHAKLAELGGNWKGTNKLYLDHLPDPLKESDSTSRVSLKVGGQFVSIEYTWSYEGEPHEGLLILGCDGKSDAVQAVWTDSWHNRDTLMLCDGTVDDLGHVNVTGSYSVPDHPDWYWRTEIVPGTGSYRYVMYNVSPEGKEELAVETDFVRA